MANTDNYQSSGFAREYINQLFKEMIFEEVDQMVPDVCDSKHVLGRSYYSRLFTWLHKEFSSGRNYEFRLIRKFNALTQRKA